MKIYRKYTEKYLKAHQIKRTADGRYITKCPKGHIHSVVSRCYAALIKSGNKPCSKCNIEKQRIKNEKVFKRIADEIWAVIDGFPRYSISNMGRVKNNATSLILRHQKVSQGGYSGVCLSNEEGHSWKGVHTLVASAFIPNPKQLDEVDHIDYNRQNCRFDNLQWITHKENCSKSAKAGHYKWTKHRKVRSK